MTNTGIPAVIFPAENGNRENGRENTPTVPVHVPVFPFCFPVFPFFSWKRFTVGLDGKRSRDRIFPSRFQPYESETIAVRFTSWTIYAIWSVKTGWTGRFFGTGEPAGFNWTELFFICASYELQIGHIICPFWLFPRARCNGEHYFSIWGCFIMVNV